MYALFIFILINNLIGMVPYSFASTSHFILTFSLSFTVVLGATILGFKEHGLKFFSLFVPAGCPLGLLPLLVIIETIDGSQETSNCGKEPNSGEALKF
jgi:F-type H+-transporting ATPase subunit a